MKIFETVSNLQSELLEVKHPVGFVPTMGALHEGHTSLILKAGNENATVVSSIFVNPAQFTQKKDLVDYPRTPGEDLDKLGKAGCDLVFMPSEAEIYPGVSPPDLDFGKLEKVMEGEFRPGHFKGVARVVARLFDIVKPDRAYFGEKDFQQLAIIREMTRRLNYPVEVVGCETIREPDGLAMSSRNIHLTNKEREEAGVIYNALKYTAHKIQKHSIASIKAVVSNMIRESGVFELQYFEIVNSQTLEPLTEYDPGIPSRACIAVITSRTRLIDNIAV